MEVGLCSFSSNPILAHGEVDVGQRFVLLQRRCKGLCRIRSHVSEDLDCGLAILVWLKTCSHKANYSYPKS